MSILAEFFAAIIFIGTSGFWFRERFEKKPIVSGIAALILLTGTYYVIDETIKRIIGIALHEKDSKPMTELPVTPSLQPDEVFWLSVKDTSVAGFFEEFLKKYPTSPHAADALARLEQIRKNRVANSPVHPPTSTFQIPATTKNQAADERFCVRVNGKRICE